MTEPLATETPTPFNEDSLRAAIASVWGEHGAHMDVYDHVLKLAREGDAVIAEDLRKTKAERDRLLPFVIQKCANCGAVTAPYDESDT